MIFAKRQYMNEINTAVFPMLQGGPHNNQIGALAVALKEASQPKFKEYAKAVVSNSQALAKGLTDRGHTLATGGTDNHLVLWDVRPHGLTGAKVDHILELVSITANKNSLPGDMSAINPGGVRLGTPALTTRGLAEDDFDVVAGFLDRGCDIAIRVERIAKLEVKAKLDENEMSRKTNKVLLKDFQDVVSSNQEIVGMITALRQDVEDFATPFFMPGQ
jgi:glycine hydroxymethyltransferase